MREYACSEERFLKDVASHQMTVIRDDGETRAYDAAMVFKSDAVPDFEFRDCWEWRCRTFTFHFIWCCYAIAWGVKTYDESKAQQVAA